MLNLKHAPSFFWIKFKQIIYKVITIKKYHINSIFNYFIKGILNFFFRKKNKNIKSLFAFDIDPQELRNQLDGAYGWLNYILPNINKYSKYKFKYLKDINFKYYHDYKIERLLIFFPQSLGYEISSKLIQNSKKIIFFVNDNVIFCKKSYNIAFNKECFKCLPKYNPHNSCKHFPYPSKDSSYIDFINTLKNKSNSILFVCHSSASVRIINSIFPNSKVLKSKHISITIKNIKVKKNKIYKHDFLFHAHMLQSKGYFYFLKIAKANPNLKFFMPNYDLVKDFYYKNIIFDKKHWNNGLQEIIYETKIILCPSFWSANFEGSVLKTMLMGKCCAIIKNINSFSADIPSNSIIKLSGNLKQDSNLLKKKLKNTTEIERIGKNARLWALNYIKDDPKKETKFLDDFLKG
ncbi:hypothetical protein N9682_06085 [Candidatus Pelagibacter sp.]|nr:hypothetical protein [Candidatus Pelagibacter sp.]